MRWHTYPEEKPKHGTVCLIKPRELSGYKVSLYVVDNHETRYITKYAEEEYDPFEYPFWISMDEIEKACSKGGQT